MPQTALGAREFSDEFIDLLIPSDGKGLVAVMRAFFDESEHAESGWFCIAGYAYERRKARRFNKEWKRLWGERVFHMSEFAHSRGVFALPDDERDRLIRKSVSIVTRTAAVGVITFCNAREIERAMAAAGEQVVGFRGPYSLCHHVCMLALGKWSRQNMEAEGVSYVFEDGYKENYDAHQFMGEIRQMPALRHAYACVAHAFEDKKRFLPIQSADLLAYEFVKFRRELGGDRPPRGSFKALVRDRNVPYEVFEVTPDTMAPWLNYTRELTDTFRSRDIPALPGE
jgi:hypothetical protein